MLARYGAPRRYRTPTANLFAGDDEAQRPDHSVRVVGGVLDDLDEGRGSGRGSRGNLAAELHRHRPTGVEVDRYCALELLWGVLSSRGQQLKFPSFGTEQVHPERVTHRLEPLVAHELRPHVHPHP